jgi:multidrug resistance efflux pump
MPEALISGDSSNANLASALVAEGPFVRAMSYRQWHYRNAYKAVMERVLDHAASTGLLGAATDSLLDQVEISVEMPPVIARKADEETNRNAVLFQSGIISKQSWSAREDLDYEEEQANREQDPSILSPEEELEAAAQFQNGGDEDAMPQGEAETDKTETEAERVT